MIFLECLPKEETSRAMQLIIVERISFDTLVARYSDNCASLLPKFALERKWKECVPRDRKWKSFDLWFSEWLTLAADVGTLTDEQKILQFDSILLKFYPKIIEKIHEEEITGQKISLEGRWNILKNKLRVHQVIRQIQEQHEGHTTGSTPILPRSDLQKRSRSPLRPDGSQSRNCFHCGQPGHFQSACPQNKGKPPFSPRRRNFGSSSRSNSRSSQGSRSASSRKSFSSRGSNGRRGNFPPHRGPRRTFSGRATNIRHPRSPSRNTREQKKGRRESRGQSSSSSHRSGYRSNGDGKTRDASAGRVDRTKLIARQRAGRCLTCGSYNHPTENCTRGRSPRRSSTPRRSSPGNRQPHRRSTSSNTRVGFRVSQLDGDPKPPALGREGDVDGEADDAEAVVDAYMAARSLENIFPARKEVADYATSSDFE